MVRPTQAPLSSASARGREGKKATDGLSETTLCHQREHPAWLEGEKECIPSHSIQGRKSGISHSKSYREIRHREVKHSQQRLGEPGEGKGRA